MEIRKLNTLRAIAALIVVVTHYSNRTHTLNGLFAHGAGKLGVMLFFILSGFLMSHLYMNNEFSGKNVRRYVVARIARVVPLFLLIVLFSYFLQVCGIRGVFYNIPNLGALVAHIALLNGDGPLWTIAPEIQFYALFVFLWMLQSKRSGYLYTCVLLVFLVLWFLGFPEPVVDVMGGTVRLKLVKTLPYFLVGVVLGQVYKKWVPPDRLRSGVFVLALLVIPFLFPVISQSLTGIEYDIWRDVMVLFAVTFVFASVVFFVPDNNVILSNPVGDFVGKVSYSLYLLHVPVLKVMLEPAKANPGLFFWVFVSASLAIATVSYVLVERPLRTVIRATAK